MQMQLRISQLKLKFLYVLLAFWLQFLGETSRLPENSR